MAHARAVATEHVLVERLRRGDHDAAAEVVRCHNRKLWRIARGILRDDAEAEEAVQEAYLRAFARIGDFRGDSSLSTWLARIVINEALRRRNLQLAKAQITEQARAKGPTSSDDHAPRMAPPPSPEQEAARAEIRAMVEGAVDALPAPFRMVFLMRVIEQMSIEETAAALGIPAATVKTRLHRANQQLRQTLGAKLAAVFDDVFPFGGARCEHLTASVLARLNAVRCTVRRKAV